MSGPSMPVHVRVCRECGEEYRPEVVRCADCGGELEDRFEGGEGTSAPAPVREEPAAVLVDYRVLFTTSWAADLVPMAERLREAGVDYRLAQTPGHAEGAPPRYALFVREKDVAGAREALADVLAPYGGAQATQGAEGSDDAEQADRECPACGTKASAGAAECPECGLNLGAGEGEVEEPKD